FASAGGRLAAPPLIANWASQPKATSKAVSTSASRLPSHFSLLVQRKVTKKKAQPEPLARPAAPVGNLRFSHRRGTARKLAELRHAGLYAPAGTPMLGSL